MNRYAIQTPAERVRLAKTRNPGNPVSFSIIKLGEGEPLPEGYELLPEKDKYSDGLYPKTEGSYPPSSKYIDPVTFEEKTVPTNLDEILERAKKVADELNG